TQITHLLIYNPHAIFPEGSIYKDENPGSLGYRAGLEAPNPMKGILGTKKVNPLAERLTYTAHKRLAGNEAFDPLNLPFPQAKFQEDTRLMQKTQHANLQARHKEIQEGFKELSAQYFGAFDSKVLERLFNQHEAQYINPRIDYINSCAFLEAMRYYARAQRLPLFEKLEYPASLKLKLSQDKAGTLVLEDTQRQIRRVETGETTTEIKHTRHDDIEVTVKVTAPLYRKYYLNASGDTWFVEFYDRKDGERVYLNEHKLEKFLQNILLHRTQVKSLPKVPQEVKQYLQLVDDPKGDLDLLLELEEVYQNYQIAFWDSYKIQIVGYSALKRPLKEAQELAQKEGLGFKEVFFHSEGKDLNPLELEKNALFEDACLASYFEEMKSY
uniref:hypothetical protein n=1 Tax=Helicobacter felis TaxID=214 RepID=UPI0018F7F3C4